MNRIVGLETEYGCLTSDFPGTPSAITRVRDWVFKDHRYGLIDVHQRDWDEPAGNGGMKITIDAVNKDGVKSQWYYTTNFDGKDQPVTGNPGTDTGAVKVLTPQVNEIIYKKAGKISQVLTNVLSLDGDTIGVMYMRMDASGKVTNITVATYERMK